LPAYLKRPSRQLVPSMDYPKQPPQGLAQTLAIGPVLSIRQRRQILHVPYQVGQAKLHDAMAFPHITTVSGKIVTAQDAVEFFSQDLHQHITTPRRINLEHRVQAGLKTLRPPLLAARAMTGLV